MSAWFSHDWGVLPALVLASWFCANRTFAGAPPPAVVEFRAKVVRPPDPKARIPDLNLSSESVPFETCSGSASTAVTVTGTLAEYYSGLIWQGKVIDSRQSAQHRFSLRVPILAPSTTVGLAAIDAYGTVRREELVLAVPPVAWARWGKRCKSVVAAANKAREMSQWWFRKIIRGGERRSVSSEVIDSQRSTTGNQLGFPAVEATLYLYQGSPWVEESTWEYFVTAAFQVNPGIGSIAFPVTYGAELGVLHAIVPVRSGIFGGLQFGVGLQWEQVVQATPDLSSLITSTVATVLSRKSQLVTGMAELALPGRISKFPFQLRFGLGHSIFESSVAPTGAAVMPRLAGWKYRGALATQLGSLFRLPFGIEGRYEQLSLSGVGSDSATNGLDRTTLGAFVTISWL